MKDIDDCIQELQELLKKVSVHLGGRAHEVWTIYTWSRGKTPNQFILDENRSVLVGLRVSEVSVVVPKNAMTAGTSYLQADLPAGLLVCVATERCLLAMHEEWGAAELWEEKQRLLGVLFGDYEYPYDFDATPFIGACPTEGGGA